LALPPLQNSSQVSAARSTPRCKASSLACRDCGCCKRQITHNWNSASNSTPSHNGVACKGKPKPYKATVMASACPGNAALRRVLNKRRNFRRLASMPTL